MSDSEPPDPGRTRSVSQLNSYTRCSLAFKLEKIDKLPSPPAAWTIRGNAVHQALQLWEESGRKYDWESGYNNSFDIFRRKAIAKYPDLDSWIRTPRVKSTEQDLKLRQADGLKQVATYVSRAEAEAHLWEPHRFAGGSLAVELPFKLDFGPQSPFYVQGYIDLLKHWKANGQVTVGDLKTGSDDGENFRQLGTYRVAAEEIYGVEVRWGEYWYSKLDRSSGWIDLSRYDKPYLYDVYSTLDRGIEEGIFIANPSKKLCWSCGVKSSCPEMAGR